MTLYSYDHCPYCVKARMIFGLKSVPMTLKTVLNDDEEKPISMVGKKMLPILEKDKGKFLPESLDIISYIDQLPAYGPPRVQASPESPALKTWLQEVREYHYALAMPRWVEMGLEEFATPSAVAYFTRKKEQSIGPFEESKKRTPQLIAQAHDHLPILEDLLVGKPYFWGEELTWDDFHVFASLRCLTTTQGLRFPKKIDDYMTRMSQESQVPLHWSKAL